MDFSRQSSRSFRSKRVLYMYEEVLLYPERVVVPNPLRLLLLKSLYAAKQIVSSMEERVHAIIMFPWITHHICTRRKSILVYYKIYFLKLKILNKHAKFIANFKFVTNPSCSISGIVPTKWIGVKGLSIQSHYTQILKGNILLIVIRFNI